MSDFERYVNFCVSGSNAGYPPPYAPQGLERLRCMRARVGIPIVAIGGITQETAPAVLAAGANAAAMIAEIGRASDIEATVRRVVAALR